MRRRYSTWSNLSRTKKTKASSTSSEGELTSCSRSTSPARVTRPMRHLLNSSTTTPKKSRWRSSSLENRRASTSSDQRESTSRLTATKSWSVSVAASSTSSSLLTSSHPWRSKRYRDAMPWLASRTSCRFKPTQHSTPSRVLRPCRLLLSNVVACWPSRPTARIITPTGVVTCSKSSREDPQMMLASSDPSLERDHKWETDHGWPLLADREDTEMRVQLPFCERERRIQSKFQMSSSESRTLIETIFDKKSIKILESNIGEQTWMKKSGWKDEQK